MAKRQIRINKASFQSGSITIKAVILTKITISAPFDQITADALGNKSQIYDENGAVAKDFDGWTGRQEFHGARLSVQAKQMNLDTANNEPQELSGLKIHSFGVARHKDTNDLRLTFSITGIDTRAEIYSLVHGIKKDYFDCTILPVPAKEAAAAEEQMALLLKPAKEEKARTEEEDEPSESAEG